MIDGRTTSRVAPCPGSPQLRVDIASKTDDVALTAVRATRASPLLSVHTNTTSIVPPSFIFSFSFFILNRNLI
jgi:hypothetical protein